MKKTILAWVDSVERSTDAVLRFGLSFMMKASSPEGAVVTFVSDEQLPVGTCLRVTIETTENDQP